MKAGLGLLLATFSLAAVAQAKYDLSCSKSELSIRWPSYESNSEYYICSRLFGRQLTVTCNPGEVFTFVLQSCTSPSRYIPAPSLKSLPLASPLVNKPNEDGFLTPIEIPNQPPMLRPPSVSVPVSPPQSQSGPPTIHMLPVIDETKPIEKEEHAVAVDEETAKPLAPLPPTPAPTPPVVEKEPSKKPSPASGKKPAKKKKSTASSATATATAAGKKNSKKPNSSAGKKTPPKKNGKKTPKAADKTPKKAAKNPKATAKNPKATAKKSPKA